MKKNWPFLLGASLFTGLAGTFFLKKKKETLHPENSTQQLYQTYTGHWQFINQQEATTHELQITDKLSILLDQKKINYLLIELTPVRLVIQDEYGYHLIIQCLDATPISLYDEADDRTYPLEAITFKEK